MDKRKRPDSSIKVNSIAMILDLKKKSPTIRLMKNSIISKTTNSKSISNSISLILKKKKISIPSKTFNSKIDKIKTTLATNKMILGMDFWPSKIMIGIKLINRQIMTSMILINNRNNF